MRIAVPAEVKNNEFRVAITPAGVHELVSAGHEVFVQSGAGVGSHIPDSDFVAAGAKMCDTAAETWQSGELVLKVKEPISSEYEYLRPGLVLFTYLHLAASKPSATLTLPPEAQRYQIDTNQGTVQAAAVVVAFCGAWSPMAHAIFGDDEARKAIIDLRQQVETNRLAADAAGARTHRIGADARQ